MKDITNVRFGSLVARRQCGRDKRGILKWECDCDCGGKKIVSGSSLRNGSTQSCGCLQKENLIKNLRKLHGERDFTETKCWYCNNAYSGCSWSADFIPVDGWNAKQTTLNFGHKTVGSYIVYECPLYDQGRR